MKKAKSKNKHFYIGFVFAFLLLFILSKSDIKLFEYIDIKKNTALISTNSSSDKNQEITSEATASEVYFLPSSTTNQLINHQTYYLSYSEKHEQAEWVAYELTKDHLQSHNFTRPYFNQDPKVLTQSAHWSNYKNSGYTRGHLLPAGDRTFSKEAYNETFWTSNISPQSHQFNTGIWNSLENRVRNWARKYDKLYVVTAGVLTDDLETIGNEKVAVPDYFYKILLTQNDGAYKMIAFLLPHKGEKKPLQEYVVTTDSIEKLTGIDFFHFLDDKIENELESKIDLKGWFK